MATSLSNGLLLTLLLQAPPDDSVRAALRARLAEDSTNAAAWLALGRSFLEAVGEYHAHRGVAGTDTVRARALLDTAQQAFDRAVEWGPGTRTADSARVFRLYAVGERAYVDWEAGGGPTAAALTWHTLPEGTRLPPVLEELGENLLRACPLQGILFTAGDADTHTAWYLRFARGLRPDLLIVPLRRWQGDSVLRRLVMGNLKLRDPSLRALGRSRAVCASMAFEREPEEHPDVKWHKRPLVWVSGVEKKSDRVPPQDFVFAALKLAIDQHETWSQAVLVIYRRAVSNVGGLCKAFETFGIEAEVGCQ